MRQPSPPWNPRGNWLPTVGEIAGAQAKNSHAGQTHREKRMPECKEPFAGCSPIDARFQLKLVPFNYADFTSSHDGLNWNLAETQTGAQYPLIAIP